MKSFIALFLTACVLGSTFARSMPKPQEDDLSSSIDSLLNSMKNMINEAVEKVETANSEAKTSMDKALDDTKGVGKLAKSTIDAGLDKIQTAVNTGMEKARDLVDTKVDAAATPLKAAAEEAVSKINMLEKCAADDGKELPPRPDLQSCVQNPAPEVRTISEQMTEAATDIPKLIGNEMKDITQCLTKKLTMVSCITTTVFSSIKGVSQIVQKFINASTNAVGKLSNIILTATKCISTGVTNTINKASSIGIDVGKCIKM